MSKSPTRIVQAFSSILLLITFLLLAPPLSFSFLDLMIYAIFLFFPLSSIVSKDSETRLISSLVTLSAIFPYFLYREKMLVYALPLLFLSIDCDLRLIPVSARSFVGSGFTSLVFVLLIQLAIGHIYKESMQILYFTLAYMAVIAFYEAYKIGRVEVRKPGTIYCNTGDLVEFSIEIYNIKGLTVKVLKSRLRTRVERREDRLIVYACEVVENVGRNYLIIPFILCGSRKFLTFKKRVRVTVEVRPLVERAVKEAVELALFSAPRLGEAGELYEAGAKVTVEQKGIPCALRPYFPGDDIRNVNYKKSVSLCKLIVNEYYKGGAEFREMMQALLAEEGYTSIVVFADLTSNDREELDRLAYRLLSIVIQLIRESLTPISLFIVVNDSVLYSARNTSARRLLVDLVSAISKVNPTRYHKASLEEPFIYSDSLDMLVEYAFLKQAVLSIDSFRALIDFMESSPGPHTLIIIKPSKRMLGAYAFIKHLALKHQYKIIEYKV